MKHPPKSVWAVFYGADSFNLAGDLFESEKEAQGFAKRLKLYGFRKVKLLEYRKTKEIKKL